LTGFGIFCGLWNWQRKQRLFNQLLQREEEPFESAAPGRRNTLSEYLFCQFHDQNIEIWDFFNVFTEGLSKTFNGKFPANRFSL